MHTETPVVHTHTHAPPRTEFPVGSQADANRAQSSLHYSSDRYHPCEGGGHSNTALQTPLNSNTTVLKHANSPDVEVQQCACVCVCVK